MRFRNQTVLSTIIEQMVGDRETRDKVQGTIARFKRENAAEWKRTPDHVILGMLRKSITDACPNADPKEVEARLAVIVQKAMRPYSGGIKAEPPSLTGADLHRAVRKQLVKTSAQWRKS